jgi:hypothetical protein
MVSYEHEIGDVAIDVKVRRPWAVAVLSIVTLGIYSAVWYYKVNREMRDYGSAHRDHRLARSKPWRSLLAVTIGGVIVIPQLVSFVRMVGRLQDVERIAGDQRPGSGLIALLVGSALVPLGRFVDGNPAGLAVLGAAAYVVAIALIQARLNAAWQESGVVAARALEATGVAGR